MPAGRAGGATLGLTGRRRDIPDLDEEAAPGERAFPDDTPDRGDDPAFVTPDVVEPADLFTESGEQLMAVAQQLTTATTPHNLRILKVFIYSH